MATTPGNPRLLRAMNDRSALDLLLSQGPLSRTTLGHLTGLSKPTASQLLARLEAANLVRASGTTAGRPGPNAQLYEINGNAAYVAGLDVTPTRIRSAIADQTGQLVGQFELPTPGRSAKGTVERVIKAIEGAAGEAGLNRANLHRVSIGTPGGFDPTTGRLRYATHLPGWHAPHLLEELAAAIAVPLEVENDVNLAAVAERQVGHAQDSENFVLLWGEEGIGAAIVVNGRLHRGAPVANRSWPWPVRTASRPVRRSPRSRPLWRPQGPATPSCPNSPTDSPSVWRPSSPSSTPS
jgi:DNA-binding transcriptional ArsR family regulator